MWGGFEDKQRQIRHGGGGGGGKRYHPRNSMLSSWCRFCGPVQRSVEVQDSTSNDSFVFQCFHTSTFFNASTTLSQLLSTVTSVPPLVGGGGKGGMVVVEREAWWWWKSDSGGGAKEAQWWWVWCVRACVCVFVCL